MQKTKAPENLIGETRRNVVILGRYANFAWAKKIAKDNNSKLPSVEEFVRWLDYANNFKKAEGNWYWLREEQGLSISGLCKVTYWKGAIEGVEESEWYCLYKGRRAKAWPGKGPLRIYVGSYDDRRSSLTLDACYSLHAVAQVALVGEPKEQTLKECVGMRH